MFDTLTATIAHRDGLVQFPAALPVWEAQVMVGNSRTKTLRVEAATAAEAAQVVADSYGFGTVERGVDFIAGFDTYIIRRDAHGCAADFAAVQQVA